MDTAHLQRVATATKITYSPYERFPHIDIPHVRQLTNDQRRIVIEIAEQQRFAQNLNNRLANLTPPPEDEETVLQEAREFDDAARKLLEADGCAPCYPSNFQLPLDDLPEPQLGAARFFEVTGLYEVLTPQLRHWERFRKHQRRLRMRYGQGHFEKYVADVRHRRQARNLGHDISLQWAWSEQTHLQNWTEYQDRQFQVLEGLEYALRKAQDELKLENPDNLPSLWNHFDFIQRSIDAQNRLLSWMEWQWHRYKDTESTSPGGTTTAKPQERYGLRPRRQAAKTPCASAELHRRYNLRPRQIKSESSSSQGLNHQATSERRGTRTQRSKPSLTATRTGRVTKSLP